MEAATQSTVELRRTFGLITAQSALLNSLQCLSVSIIVNYECEKVGNSCTVAYLPKWASFYI
jgi:hypothetical protein